MKQIFFWNSLAFSMMQRMLAIWSLVPLPFLNSACTSGSSQFTYCWSLAWRIVSMWNEMLCSYSTWNNWKWNLFHFHPLATICLLTTPKYLLYVSFKQICLSIKKGIYWDFPGSSVVGIPSLQETQVLSLTRELGSCMPQCGNNNNNNK